MANAPRGREKNVTGQGKNVYRRGQGLGTGPVGSPNGHNGRSGGSNAGPGQRSSGSGQRNSGGQRSSGGGSGSGKLIAVIIAAAVLLLGGGGAGIGSLISSLSSSSDTSGSYYSTAAQNTNTAETAAVSSDTGSSASGILSMLLGGGSLSGSNVSTGWTMSSNNGVMNTETASGTRDRYTTVKGDGSDTVTIMVYMCGADLESKSGMATSDLTEMAAATLSDKINLLVYTGGAAKWQNNVVSSTTSQIYKVENGKFTCLESDLGQKTMTAPENLASFIQYCAKNYPADRSDLILWDHGGGSISGYGYDENFPNSGSMSLQGISQALKSGGVKFDFVGFDACLMASVENGLMLSSYADYMIASEETEPGVGWYYTDWLTKLSENPSMSTVEIGKNIADDFVSVCAQKCSGQKTTLSVVDLAELSAVVPDKLTAFASSTSELLQNDSYSTVSNARSSAREFGTSSKIDQVDLVSLGAKLGTDEGKSLAEALLGCVKYNRTASSMTDAYGLSIYFPYQKVSRVSTAVAAYDAIDMDDEYAKCIQKFASMEVSGQAVSGGSSSPVNALLGGSSSSSYTGSDAISSLLSSLLSGSTGSVSGLTSENSSFLGKSIDPEADAAYLESHQFDASALVWTEDADGSLSMDLAEDQWNLVQDLELNVFQDDGQGYIDLGLDNVYQFTDSGRLSGTYDGTWLAVNGQPVAYYHTDTAEEGDTYTISGYIPAMVNEVRCRLLVVFDDQNPYGYLSGIETVYTDDETGTVGKAITSLEKGDEIDFLCDYYAYDGTYEDSYYLGDRMVYDGTFAISNVYIDADAANAVYRFTDIYNQNYWTPAMQ